MKTKTAKLLSCLSFSTLLFMVSLVQFANAGSGSHKTFKVRNCITTFDLRVMSYNGDDGSCNANHRRGDRSWGSRSETVKDFQCHGNDTERCKMRVCDLDKDCTGESNGYDTQSDCKNIPKHNSSHMYAVVVISGDDEENCPHTPDRVREADFENPNNGFTRDVLLCLYDQNNPPSCP